MSRKWLDIQHDEIKERNRRLREAQMQEARRLAEERNRRRR